MSFPKNFLIGAATAAHQVEGNNVHSDLWAQEHMVHTSFSEPSGLACDHYNRYEEDIRMMAENGLNAYRFSIEWARIEPEEGRFDEEEIEHYRKVLHCCKENGIIPIVTLHHFSSPKWLMAKGGWESEDTVEYFKRYSLYVAEQLGSEMGYVCTINEANMGLQISAIAKRYLLQMQENAETSDGKVQMGLNLEKMMESRKAAEEENLKVFGTANPQTFQSPRTAGGDLIIMKAHAAARDAIKAVCPHLKVGLSLSLHDVQPQPGGVEEAKREWDEEFVHYLPYMKQDDFLGVQNYTRMLMGPDGQLPSPENAEKTQMDYEFYPEGLEHVIRSVSEQFHGELMVTENGIATADDSRRIEFIRKALEGVQKCVDDGFPVTGYLYWSLLDNFEWQKGYSMTFGLVGVDRATQKRSPKPSLAFLGSHNR